MATEFEYMLAFSRNIGWVTQEEQSRLQRARVAIGGLGGVGGSHLVTLARLGVGQFSVADLDDFDVPNFNRQYGASVSTVGKSKLAVMSQAVRDINPEVTLHPFDQGINLENVDDFLSGTDLYMDSLDIFSLEIRRKVFQRCHELGIPAITAAPMGMGTAILVFLPGRMSFEDYFCFDDVRSFEDKLVKFVIGVSPAMLQRRYLVKRSSVNFLNRKVPSTAMGIELAAGVAGTQALKVLLGRGSVVHAPRGLHFDAYRNRLVRTWRPWGNRNPLQRMMFWRVRQLLSGSAARDSESGTESVR